MFVTAANDGYIFTSTNGVGWAPYFSSYFVNLRAVCFAEGFWTVVGNSGWILTSPDFLTWTRRPTRTFENLHGVGYLAGRFITMGNRGTVLQSGRSFTELTPPRYSPSVGAIVGLKGIIGRSYQFQASTNLLQWTNLFRFTNTTDEVSLTDTNAIGRPRRYYRLLEN